jgi:hypothetical protein
VSARWSWLTLAALVLVVGGLSLLRGLQPPDSPEHSSASDSRQGTSALLLYAQAMGHPTSAFRSSFDLPTSGGLVFVFNPTQPFSPQEAEQLRSWVAGGGTLVYGSTFLGDVELDRALGLHRLDNVVAAAATAPAPALAGVRNISGDVLATPFRPLPGQVPVLRAGGGEALALVVPMGGGRVVALSDPLPLCNGFLGQADNGRLAADLISLAGPGGAVAFDEFHHAAPPGGGAEGSWVVTPWGMAISWGVLALFCGLALRGRAFGPRLPIGLRGEPSGRAYLAAVADLLGRARARRDVLRLLREATQRRLEQRAGFSSGRSLPAAGGRPPSRLEAQMSALQDALENGADSDQALVAAARQMHALAHPLQTPRS